MKKITLFCLAAGMGIVMFSSCGTNEEPKLVFKFKLDETQPRLNNWGQPDTLPANHRAQNPEFNLISSHYIELAPTAFTGLGSGEQIYIASETTAGGSGAIDFSQSINVAENEVFYSVPLSEVTAGTYEWIRVSLAYQNYDIQYRVSPPAAPVTYDGTGTIAAFIGYNTYISSYLINTQSMTVNGNRLQGYWGFETTIPGLPPVTFDGQAPPGATTVPNPIFVSSPVPAGSCVVTGPFTSPLVITGNETEDIVITLSLSTNGSFEWIEGGGNNYFEPMNGDTVVDMGIRGLIPIVE